jgi:hypothetical protein
MVTTLSLAALHLGSTASNAGETQEFHQAVADAYGHYREAYFYVSRGGASVAAFELEPLVEKWRAVMDRFAGNPPDTYAADPEWSAALEEIDKRARDGLAAALAGDAEAAKGHLMPIRRVLVDLRRRNNVFLFADYVEEANSAFRKLFYFRRHPPDFANESQVDALRQALTVTIQWYSKTRDNAPLAIANDEQFKRLITDSLYYLDRIWLAINDKKPETVVSILRRVVSSDKLLWLRFG